MRERQADIVAQTCRHLEQAEEPVPLAELAERAGLSPWYLQRLFRARMGVSPRAYAAALRAERLRTLLPQAASVTSAAYHAGFGSSGRFYAAAEGALGMSPARYRSGGQGMRIEYASAACALGHVIVARTSKGICAILLGDRPGALEEQLRHRFPRAVLHPGADALRQELALVVGLIEQPGRSPDVAPQLPLDIQGTAFQLKVWQALQAIPPGQRRSYRDLARAIGAPNAVRAVGAACAANPVAVAIPCHRAVRSDGSLAGYAWGLERKQALLAREAEATAAQVPAQEFQSAEDRQ